MPIGPRADVVPVVAAEERAVTTTAGRPAEPRADHPAGRRPDRLVTGLRVTAHLYALGPLAIAVFVTLAGRLTANPIEDLTRRLGQDALLLLTLSLAVSPTVWLVGAGWRRPHGPPTAAATASGGAEVSPAFRRRLVRALRPLRRIFGLYAFAYACLHLFFFAVVDYGLVPSRLAEAVFQKRYALVGFVAFVLLALLAGASTAGRRRRIGAAWAPVQRLVYPAALLVVLHMLWAAKVVTPARVAWAGVVVVLLLLRLPMWWSSRRLRAGRGPSTVGVTGTTPVGRADG
jgi:methionine sulfoxide reductase heme-binding subunit